MATSQVPRTLTYPDCFVHWLPSNPFLSFSALNGISLLSIMTTSASRAMIATSAIFMALAIMAVVLRLHLRQKQKFPGSKADDWLIVAALVWLE